ncbi:HipA family kinase [Spirosoma pollinicola]|nr:HipA family kinase [Spirosoma pollinicola]
MLVFFNGLLKGGPLKSDELADSMSFENQKFKFGPILKILEATSYQSPIRSGGSTKPWLTQVNDQGNLVPYVVKLFTKKQTLQLHPIAKEVFGNILAQEFDLIIPECALIMFSDTFVNDLPEREALRLREIADGLKFGSKEIPNSSIVDVRQQRSLLKSYNMGTIFAFDNLVWNLDRGGARNKPNLLIDDDTLILIDHEQIFPFANDTLTPDAYVMPSFDRSAWYYPYDKHLFYPLLKRMSVPEKASLFETFQYFLENLSLSSLDSEAITLQFEGIEIGNYPVIREHLLQTKARAGEFCKFLTTLIA